METGWLDLQLGMIFDKGKQNPEQWGKFTQMHQDDAEQVNK